MRGSRLRLEGARTLGLLGTLLALLTMAAAFGFGLLALFGRLLLASAVVTIAWPMVFTVDFTQRVFGEPRISFFKIFLLLLAAGTVINLLTKGFKKQRG